jgi:hypothetical protein
MRDVVWGPSLQGSPRLDRSARRNGLSPATCGVAAEVTHGGRYRGMLTSACIPGIARLRERGGIDWISALRAPAIRLDAAGGHSRGHLEAAIGLRAGRVVDAKKMAKHFTLEIGAGHFAYRRRDDAIAAEVALDGFYVIRTSVPAGELPAPAGVDRVGVRMPAACVAGRPRTLARVRLPRTR